MKKMNNMEAKLIKVGSVYYLVDNSEIKNNEYYLAWETNYSTPRWVTYVLVTGLNGVKQYKIIACTEELESCEKLSLKNCQAVERGYDLDELAREFCHPGNGVRDNFQPVFKGIFIQGFQKCLELMGNKKFSEEDMKSFAQNYYREIRENKSNLLWSELADKCLKEHIQSLQQTEWDVEIEMEEIQEIYRDGTTKYERVPKLDADGCLILKRI